MTTDRTTKIALYSDEPIEAYGFASILNQLPRFNLLPVCSTVASLSETMTTEQPHLCLISLTREITFAVLSDLRRAMSSTKTILWVSSISTELAFQVMGLGVRGVLRKTLSTKMQIKCLDEIDAGALWFEKPLTDSILCARRIVLTQREGQLCTLLANGMKNKEIATTLNIGEGTVKVYLSRLFKKCAVKDRYELALFALRNIENSSGPQRSRGPESVWIPGLRSLVVRPQPPAPHSPESAPVM